MLVDTALGAATSDEQRALASAFFGELALALGELREAVDAIERARTLDPDVERHEPNAADALGRAYAQLAEYESAVAVFRRAHDRAVAEDDAVGTIRFGSLLASVYTDAGRFSAAEETLAGVLRVADGLEDPVSRARAFWAQSRLRSNQRDGDAAAAYAQRARSRSSRCSGPCVLRGALADELPRT